jgi:hypothetical protein
MKIDLPTEDFYEEQISMKKKIVEKKGKNMQKRHKQLSDPWNQVPQKDLMHI